jgi:plastocyanin domain-containing protein
MIKNGFYMEGKTMRKSLIFVAALFLTLVALHYAWAELSPSGMIKGNMRIINVELSKSKINPDPVVVKSGEMVFLLVKSGEDCKFNLPAFKIEKDIPAQKVTAVSFVSKKAGSFKFYCTFGRLNVKSRVIVLKTERKSK